MAHLRKNKTSKSRIFLLSTKVFFISLVIIIRIDCLNEIFSTPLLFGVWYIWTVEMSVRAKCVLFQVENLLIAVAGLSFAFEPRTTMVYRNNRLPQELDMKFFHSNMQILVLANIYWNIFSNYQIFQIFLQICIDKKRSYHMINHYKFWHFTLSTFELFCT